jgi:hypothetical protein
MLLGQGAAPRKIKFGIGAGCKFIIDPAEKSQRALGLEEAELAKSFSRSIATASTFIDVGSSDGYYAILAMWLNPKVTAIGCEPQPDLANRAWENYRLNWPEKGPHLEWLESPVGSGDGQVTLDQIGSGRTGPIVVKIDVDGYESEVLASGKALLSRIDCVVLLEVHSRQLETSCMEFLNSCAFSCRIVRNAWWRALIPEKRPLELNRWVIAEKAHAQLIQS